MAAKVNYIPEGHHTVSPYLVIPGIAKVIEFVKQAFGAQEVHLSKRPDGTVQHAEIKIGDSIVMMGEAAPDGKNFPGMLHLYVEDVDTVYQRAIAAGGKSIREPADQPYGDRTSGVDDGFGNQWWISTHIKDV
jgi:PhnB protein